jgi:hypothetical protein
MSHLKVRSPGVLGWCSCHALLPLSGAFHFAYHCVCYCHCCLPFSVQADTHVCLPDHNTPGAGSEAAERVTTEGLASDMAAFKAANPGAVLEVGGWYHCYKGSQHPVLLAPGMSWAAHQLSLVLNLHSTVMLNCLHVYPFVDVF